MSQINIYGLGYRNPITESEQIIWFWEQQAKKVHTKRLSCFWLNVKEIYGKQLLRMKADELNEYISGKTTEKQQQKRAEYRLVSTAKAQLERAAILEQYKEDNRQFEEKMFRIRLIGGINYN